jgi:RNA polymerase sigma-70 factor, ECF subfamily
MDSELPSDHSLIERIRGGDDDAATTLYQRYADRVKWFVQSRASDKLKQQVEPEDIVQSIFKSVFKGMESRGYDAPEGGTLWHLIAVVAIHKIRKNATRRNAAMRDSRRTESLDSFDAGQTSEVEASQEMELAVREAIESLSPQEQSVVNLRLQSYSVEEIAKQLGCSPRTVERRLQQVRAALSESFDLAE